VTIIVNHPAAGIGGGGTRLQSTLGIVSTGPAVLCPNVVATL